MGGKMGKNDKNVQKRAKIGLNLQKFAKMSLKIV